MAKETWITLMSDATPEPKDVNTRAVSLFSGFVTTFLTVAPDQAPHAYFQM